MNIIPFGRTFWRSHSGPIGLCSFCGLVACSGSVRAATLTRRPYIQNTTASSVYILWNTDKLTNGRIDYSPIDKSRTSRSKASNELVSRHAMKLNGLQPATSYRYRVSDNAGTSWSGTFQTNRRPTDRWSLTVWGDSGVGSAAQKKLASRIESLKPDLLLHTGDLIYPRGAERGFNPNFFNVYALTLSRVPFYGALGNHDTMTRGGQPFLTNFVFPANGPNGRQSERSYSFDYANAHIAVVDANAGESTMRRVIGPWLDRDLRASRARWKFVVWHQPPFSSGLHGDDSRVQRTLVPVVQRNNVDVVFNGHDHGYERLKPPGRTLYVVTGAGGAGLYRQNQRSPYSLFYANSEHSVTRIVIFGSVLRAEQVTASGKVLDRWTINKPARTLVVGSNGRTR